MVVSRTFINTVFGALLSCSSCVCLASPLPSPPIPAGPGGSFIAGSTTVILGNHLGQSQLPFTDRWDFDLAANLALIWSVGQSTGPNPNPPPPFETHISSLTFELFNGSNVSLGTGLNGQLGLVAGSYYAVVKGLPDGAFGGAYGLGLSTVPEPTTLALTALAFGLMIPLARRHRAVRAN